jgi:sigma-B regulation protein RsbU (phosphoserine phosphatase)
METAVHDALRRQLSDRQNRLRSALSSDRDEDQLVRLLEQVDSALARMDAGDYAQCLVCGDDVNDKDLLQNPLLQYCLCDLTPQQQRALEQDLQLARQIQAGLLPEPHFVSAGWEAYFRYEPLGMVSGDFCDLWTQPGEPDTVYFAVGDVSGKGVAASLLMSHLQAAFRSLLEAGVPLPLSTLVERVNRQLFRASIPTHYATLACGRLAPNGDVEIVNAGHCPPLIVRSTGIDSIATTGFPVGLLADRSYELNQFKLDHGDTLVLYTDGLTEAGRNEEFGFDRLQRVLAQRSSDAGRTGPRELVFTIRQALATFLGEAPVADDLTIMAVQRSHRGEA